MAQAMLSVRIDKNEKLGFERFCETAGMNVSVAVTMFIKAVLREQKLPFEVVGDPFYSNENMSRLEKSISQLENGGGTIHDIGEYLD